MLERLDGGRRGDRGGGERQAKAADLGALAQPPAAVVPARQALTLEPAPGEGGVLARHGEGCPMGAGATGTAKEHRAVAHATDPDAVTARLGVRFDEDGPVGEHEGVVAALDRADL